MTEVGAMTKVDAYSDVEERRFSAASSASGEEGFSPKGTQGGTAISNNLGSGLF